MKLDQYIILNSFDIYTARKGLDMHKAMRDLNIVSEFRLASAHRVSGIKRYGLGTTEALRDYLIKAESDHDISEEHKAQFIENQKAMRAQKAAKAQAQKQAQAQAQKQAQAQISVKDSPDDEIPADLTWDKIINDMLGIDLDDED